MFDLKSDHLKRTKVCCEGTLNAFKFLFLLNVKKDKNHNSTSRNEVANCKGKNYKSKGSKKNFH